MLLEASQHQRYLLTGRQNFLDVASASTLLLFGSTVLPHSRTGMQSVDAGDQWETFLRGGRRCYSTTRGRYLTGICSVQIITRLIPPSSKHSRARRSRAICSIRFQF